MPHFARIFFIAFTLAAASCASERAQKEEAETKEAARQLTATLAGRPHVSDPRQTLRGRMRLFTEFCVADPVRYQLLLERPIPGFEPASWNEATNRLGKPEPSMSPHATPWPRMPATPG